MLEVFTSLARIDKEEVFYLNIVITLTLCCPPAPAPLDTSEWRRLRIDLSMAEYVSQGYFSSHSMLSLLTLTLAVHQRTDSPA